MDRKEQLKSKISHFSEQLEKGYTESAEQHPKLHRLTPFIAKLLVAGLVFRSIIFLDPDTYILQEYLAAATTAVLNLLGGSYQLQNATIIGGNANYLITRDCLGWKSVSAFIGLVFASTSNYTEHLKIVTAGVLGLLVANLVRVVTTVWLSELGVISFEIIHTFMWRWGMTFLVLSAWYIWLKKYKDPNL